MARFKFKCSVDAYYKLFILRSRYTGINCGRFSQDFYREEKRGNREEHIHV